MKCLSLPKVGTDDAANDRGVVPVKLGEVAKMVYAAD